MCSEDILLFSIVQSLITPSWLPKLTSFMDLPSILTVEPYISVHFFDISGANILLDKTQTNIKLADFGISTIMEVSSRFYL